MNTHQVYRAPPAKQASAASTPLQAEKSMEIDTLLHLLPSKMAPERRPHGGQPRRSRSSTALTPTTRASESATTLLAARRRSDVDPGQESADLVTPLATAPAALSSVAVVHRGSLQLASSPGGAGSQDLDGGVRRSLASTEKATGDSVATSRIAPAVAQTATAAHRTPYEAPLLGSRAGEDPHRARSAAPRITSVHRRNSSASQAPVLHSTPSSAVTCNTPAADLKELRTFTPTSPATTIKPAAAPTDATLDTTMKGTESALQQSDIGEETLKRRVSGVTFSVPTTRTAPPITDANADSSEARSPQTLQRLAPPPKRIVIARPKERNARAASVGTTVRRPVVPTLELSELSKVSNRTSEPERKSRSPEMQLPRSKVEKQSKSEPKTSKVTTGLSGSYCSDSVDTGVQGDFILQAVLSLNNVQHADSGEIDMVDMAHAAAMSTPANSSSLLTQRRVSTPLHMSAQMELRALTQSPVQQAMRGRRSTSVPTTPRRSASTPRFTVATSGSSLAYTARMEQSGTPRPVASASVVATGSRSSLASPAASAVTTPRAGLRESSPTAGTAPTALSTLLTEEGLPRTTAFTADAFMKADSQDYVLAVSAELEAHYFVVLTAQDIGRVAALMDDPPHALCLRSMLIDLNTVACLLSYDSRHGLQDVLFEDCVFSITDMTWLHRLRGLTALRIKGTTLSNSTVNQLVTLAASVQTVTLINADRVASLSFLDAPTCRVRFLQLIHTDFSGTAYRSMVKCPSLRQVMLLQVQLRLNVFDLMNTNHLLELHLVGCPDMYYETTSAESVVTTCPSLRRTVATSVEAKAAKMNVSERFIKVKVPQEAAAVTRAGTSVPLRMLVLADCPGLRLSAIPFHRFDHLLDVSIMYQRGVRAEDLAGLFDRGELVTLRLQEVFVDAALIAQLQRCTRLQELNLSYCRGLRGLRQLWPALAETLRHLNLSYSDVDEEELVGLEACRMLCQIYARGCARLRRVDAARHLPFSLDVLDLAGCADLRDDGFRHGFACTGLTQLRLDDCVKVRDITGIASVRMLEGLSLAGTGIDDAAFETLALNADSVVLQTLTALDLSRCPRIFQLADFTAVSRGALRNLATLTVAHSSINDTGLSRIAQAVEAGGGGCLAELDLSYCLGVRDLGPLGTVRTLEVLNASFTGLSDVGLAAYVESSEKSFNKTLHVLELNGCMAVRDIGCIGRLRRLAILHLAGTTLDGVVSFGGLQQCTGLLELDLSESLQIRSVAALLPALTKLRALNLSLTGITDDSVAAMSALTELEVLQLSGCAAVQSVAAIGELGQLQRLNLSATGVTDLSPLVRCPHLWDLCLSSCAELRSLQPLAGATALQRLDASDTFVTSDSFQKEWTCALLEELDLHGCTELRTVKPGVLRQLISLRRVNACDSEVGDSFVEALGDCANLCEVQLSRCPITSLNPLGRVASMQTIIANGTNVGSCGVVSFAASQSLHTLDLGGCSGLADVSPLSALRSLTKLVLRETAVSDASFADSWEVSGVRELDLCACLAVAEPALLHTIPELEVLSASGSGLTNAGVRLLAQCQQMRRLQIADCPHVTVLSPLLTLSRLSHLDASTCPVTTLACTDSCVSSLRVLTLQGCAALADVSALRTLGLLRNLDLSHSGVTVMSFVESWVGCAVLEEVVLSSCFSLRHVRGLWAAPQLRRVRLDGAEVDSLEGAGEGTSVEWVDLSACSRLADVSALKALPRLQQLLCRKAGVSDISFVEPWTSPSLATVDLTGCAELRDIRGLANVPSLRSANLSNTPVTDGALRALSKAAALLEVLDLRDCPRLVHLSALARLPRLRALYLSRTGVDNFTVTSLTRCAQLEVLEMEECPTLLTFRVVADVSARRTLKLPPVSRLCSTALAAYTNLDYLSVHDCPRGFSVDTLACLPRLRVLELRGGAFPAQVLAALDHCQALEELDLSYCGALHSLDALGALPRLRCLTASGLPVTDSVCEKLLAYPTLEKLVLAECTELRDVSALRDLRQLHHLDLSESSVAEVSLFGVACMRALEELSLQGCTSIHSCRALSDGIADGVRLPRLRLLDLARSGIPTTALSSEIAALRRCCPLLAKIYVDRSCGPTPVKAPIIRGWRTLLNGWSANGKTST